MKKKHSAKYIFKKSKIDRYCFQGQINNKNWCQKQPGRASETLPSTSVASRSSHRRAITCEAPKKDPGPPMSQTGQRPFWLKSACSVIYIFYQTRLCRPVPPLDFWTYALVCSSHCAKFSVTEEESVILCNILKIMEFLLNILISFVIQSLFFASNLFLC